MDSEAAATATAWARGVTTGLEMWKTGAAAEEEDNG